MPRRKKKHHFIYKTTNNITKKYYIGMHSTHNIDDGYMGSGLKIRRSLKKYGNENHTIEILEFLPNREKLKEREKQIVNEDILKDNMCMNLQIGGGGGFLNGNHQFKCSQSAGLKHSDRMLNDEEYRKKYSEKLSEAGKRRHQRGELKTFKYSQNGKKHSSETKKLMSNSKKGTGNGDLNSQFGTQWITNDIENKKIKKGGTIPNGWKLGRKSKIQGELVKNSKLKEKDVKLIKELLNNKNLSQKLISMQFNVRPETISKINRGLIWKN
jgi:hypothetical protein